jgi:hypothetical protein
MTSEQEKEYLELKKKEEVSKVRSLRLRVKNSLILIKAKAKGITVTDEEITNYIKQNNL